MNGREVGFSGLHPYLPCERCFRLPPATSGPCRAQGPVCLCVPPATYAAVERVLLERRGQEHAKALVEARVDLALEEQLQRGEAAA